MRIRSTSIHWRAGPALALLGAILMLTAIAAVSLASQPAPQPLAHAPKETRWITADHSKFPALQGNFTSGPEVTKACLSCHTEAASQIHKTIHWTWKCPHDETGTMGKYGKTLNNFCVAVPSNEPRCTSCHIGYGFKDKTFDFSDANRIDCLVCHDRTGTYKKYPTMAGNPVSEPTVFPEDNTTYLPPDWNKVAQGVGRPDRTNCGNCHFYGGGGDAVKHGDQDSSMANPPRTLDVHMAKDGANFSCARCHTTEAHRIAGRCYKTPAATHRKSLVEDDTISRITCESCHTSTPHKPGVKANDHTDKVACQTCHIPAFARELATKMSWDWSTAGKMKDGKPFKIKNEFGVSSYDSKKGDFDWQKNVVPVYAWFNGTMEYLTIDDTIDPATRVAINSPVGAREDINSRIYPFKMHTGKQPYDTRLNRFVIPHLFGKDDAAYWQSYDWAKAIAAGMAYINQEYSGEYGFVETSYVFQTTHMVAPKEQSLACESCHTRDNSRLQQLAGFYMPGRDSVSVIDQLGWGLVLLSLAGVFMHGLARVIASKKRS